MCNKKKGGGKGGSKKLKLLVWFGLFVCLFVGVNGWMNGMGGWLRRGRDGTSSAMCCAFAWDEDVLHVHVSCTREKYIYIYIFILLRLVGLFGT